MNPVLLTSADCPSCREAERVWTAACSNLGMQLTCLDVDEAAGRRLVARLGLVSLPVLIINDAPAAAGVPEPEAASRLLTECSRQGDSRRPPT